MAKRRWMEHLFVGPGAEPGPPREDSATAAPLPRPGHTGRVTCATLSGHFLDVAVDIRAWLNRAGIAVEVSWREDCRGNRAEGPRFVEVAPAREEAAKRFLARLQGEDWYALGNFDPGGTDGTFWGGELLGATGQRHAFSARNPARDSPWNRFVAAHVELASDALRGLRATEVLDGLRGMLGMSPVHIRNFKGTPQVTRVFGALPGAPAETRGLLEGIACTHPLVIDLGGLGLQPDVAASADNVEVVLEWARAREGALVVLPRHPRVREKATGFEQAFDDLESALRACVN